MGYQLPLADGIEESLEYDENKVKRAAAQLARKKKTLRSSGA